MGLEKRRDSNVVWLEVKHFCIWQQIKAPVEGCEAVEVKNPKTSELSTKYGYKYDTLNGHAIKLEWYDTANKYSTRYIGYKLHLADEGQVYVLDMPYQSMVLRRFLRAAPNIDWNVPLAITAFKAKGEKQGDDSTGIWFRQEGETIKPFYTKDNPNGMPSATQDPVTHEWDFKPQHRWLVSELNEHIVPAIADHGEKYRAQRPERPEAQTGGLSQAESEPVDWNAPIDDSDVPF